MGDDVTPAAEPANDGLQAEIEALKARLKEINDEAKGHRLNAKNARTEAETVRAEMEAARLEAAGKISEAEKKVAEAAENARKRGIAADMRIAAKDAGIRDVADLALLDQSKIEVDDDGNVTNAVDLLNELKKSKPYLFGQASSSSTVTAPKPDNKPKSATDMTPAEWAAEKKRLGIR